MISPGSGETLACNPNVTFQKLGDDLVVVNLESDTIYTLNATAAVAWEMLHKGLGMDKIRARLLQEYEVDEKTIDQELSQTLEKFKNLGLLITEPPTQ